MSNQALVAQPSKDQQLETAAKPGKSLGDLLDLYKDRIASVAPAHLSVDRIMRLAQTAHSKSEYLAQCTVSSILSCLVEGSRVGLEPCGAWGYWMVPFRNKHGQWEAQAITDYRGLIALVTRSGDVKRIMAHTIYQRDHYEVHGAGVFDHVPNDYARDEKGLLQPVDRGEHIAFYAVAHFADGTQFKLEPLSVAQIEAYRARSRAKDAGPWKSDWLAMALKTAVRRLCNWLPQSPEVRQVLAHEDEAEYEGTNVTIDATPPPASPSPKGATAKLGALLGATASTPQETNTEGANDAAPESKTNAEELTIASAKAELKRLHDEFLSEKVSAASAPMVWASEHGIGGARQGDSLEAVADQIVKARALLRRYELTERIYGLQKDYAELTGDSTGTKDVDPLENTLAQIEAIAEDWRGRVEKAKAATAPPPDELPLKGGSKAKR